MTHRVISRQLSNSVARGVKRVSADAANDRSRMSRSGHWHSDRVTCVKIDSLHWNVDSYRGLATRMLLSILVSRAWLWAAVPSAHAAPCLIVTLTGTMGGPPTYNGLAGAGTLVLYGDDGNNCNAVKMQFDAGRGTNMRLSQVGVPEWQLDAIFFTHMHTDHTEGFADILQL